MLTKFLNRIGKITISIIKNVGRYSIFSFQSIINIVLPPFYLKSILSQFIVIGFYSLPVVALTAFFSGAVLALQSYTGFSRFSAEGTIATVVVLSITRELGPVLAGLMVAGRVGSSIAAEIGTMRVTEQIDALYTLSTEPLKYLITPRLIASLISLPCLVIVCDIIGVMGGYCISVYKLGFNPSTYIINTFKYLEIIDVVSGLVKALIFGIIIAIVSCYCGYYSDKGARGVGSATIKAVVNSSILILISNYIVTLLFF